MKMMNADGFRRSAQALGLSYIDKGFDTDFCKAIERDGYTTVFPIPADIITLNPNLVQNKGY